MPSITEIAKQSISAFTGKKSGSSNPMSNTGPKNDLGNAIASGLISGINRGMNQDVKDKLSLVGDFRIGALLSRGGKISGTTANIIDSVIGLISGNKNKRIFAGQGVDISSLDIEEQFVPIVIKTTQKILLDDSGSPAKEFYVVFDSTPDQLAFTKSANWTAKEVPGRPEPIQIFNSSSPMTFNLSGAFFARSKKDLMSKLALGESLMALVAPSKHFHMPSTVTVMIGEWMHLHCIVNSVTVTYQGPWWIPTEAALADRAKSALATDNAFDARIAASDSFDKGEYISSAVSSADANQAYEASKMIGSDAWLPSHAPYFFIADFQFTTVSKGASVSYAEDILTSRLSEDVVRTRVQQSEYSLLIDDGTGVKSIVNIPSDITNVKAIETAVTEYHNAGLNFSGNRDINDYLAKVREAADTGIDQDRNNALLGSLTNNIGNAASNYLKRIASKNKGLLGKVFK